MRITMQTIHQNILGNLNKLTTDMNRINSQISSGKQFSKISEDPVNLITALNLRTKISEIEQYQDNIQFGDKAINAAESSLTAMKDLTIRAKVLSLQMINGSMTPENRKTMTGEIQQLLEETITLANTSVNGKYIFGGFRTSGYTDVEPTPFIQDTRDRRNHRSRDSPRHNLSRHQHSTIDRNSNTPFRSCNRYHHRRPADQ